MARGTPVAQRRTTKRRESAPPPAGVTENAGEWLAATQPGAWVRVHVLAGSRARRRRVDVALLALGVLLTGLVAGFGAYAGERERVVALWVRADVASDGTASVTEVIDYDFGRARRHGIFRDVPDLATDASISVSSPTAPDGVVVSRSGDRANIRIGDPSRTVTGRHRYSIRYRLESVVEGGRLAWDAVGTDWAVPIADIRVHVVAPLEFDRLGCVRGDRGSTRRCTLSQTQPGHLETAVASLDPGQGVTVSAGVARPVVAPASPPLPAGRAADLSPVRIGILGMAAALATAAVGSFLIRWAGRERVAAGGAADAAWAEAPQYIRRDAAKLAELATIELAPPEGLSPAQGGLVLAEDVQDAHKAAWLVQAAIDGYIDIEERGGVTLVRRDVHTDSEDATAAILDTAFAGRRQVWLGAYDERFAKAWADLGHALAAWERTSGLWDPAGDRRRLFLRTAGVVALAPGMLLTAVAGARATTPASPWLGVTLAGAVVVAAAWAAVCRAWELRVRTPFGSGLWLRVESFRRFLADSEAHHAEEAAERGVLREYTAWAVALGAVDRWCAAVRAAGTAIPDIALREVGLAPSLGSATVRTTVAPVEVDSWMSSGGGSSGGGGDGGSVGSGSGGGGGGSW